MSIATGVSKKVIIAKQSAKGTIAAADAATAVYLRRTSSDLSLTKETYQSNEIRDDAQVADFRHGVKAVEGTISGELSPGSYELLMAAALRKDFAAGGTMNVAAQAAVAAATTGGAAGTFTRDDAEGSWITDGFKVGDVVRFTGWASAGAGAINATANSNHNFLITALSATVMTVYALDGVAIVTKAKNLDTTIACAVVGQKSYVPLTAHTADWFTVEHNYSDVDLSENYWDCRVNSMAIKLPASGMATIDFGVMGLQFTSYAAGVSPYFSNPAAAGTKGVVAAANGAIYVQGTKVATITSMDIDLSGNMSSEPVVGSDIKPDIFAGRVIVKGNMTVFFEDATFRDYFVNETEISINCVFTTSNAANADFIAISMPRVKVGGASKDDGEIGLKQTMPFQALLDTAGGTATTEDTLKTTLSIQDSSLS